MNFGEVSDFNLECQRRKKKRNHKVTVNRSQARSAINDSRKEDSVMWVGVGDDGDGDENVASAILDKAILRMRQ